MDAFDQLTQMLRPAGGGLYLVSTGREEQLALQRRLYGVTTDDGVDAQWRSVLQRIGRARTIIMGVPSDVGAGFIRGANMGPQGIRTTLLDERPNLREWMDAHGVIDIGDVFVVPQLLHDDMLSAVQIGASRAALYPQLSAADAATLPVSPLSIAERVLDCVYALNPKIVPVVFGGDHSCAWPVVSALSRARGADWGIVQSDAHTDLLEERLGVRYCFATWSFHANAKLGRHGKMVQVGIRATRHPRAHWEATTEVVQHWATVCNERPDEVIDSIVDHLKALGVRAVYFSNDIDGTDSKFADATGTPEPDGLHPDFVVALIRRLGRSIGLCAGDVMEVAPPLVRSPGGVRRTLAVAARYAWETLTAIDEGPS